jgi:hypothetical protein
MGHRFRKYHWLLSLMFMFGMSASIPVEAGPSTREAVRITLVGASIGKAWHFDRLGERISAPGYQFAYLGNYDFDKGPLIEDLATARIKPDIVMIKECATYFPGDLDRYQHQIVSWVGKLRAAGIRPVLVTTAPVAEPTDLLTRAKNTVKQLVGIPTRLESELRFNDWLRDHADREKIPVFDIEAHLRRSDSNRWLRNEFDAGDGLHLNEAAYRNLDNAFSGFLAGWNGRAP